MKEKVFTTKNVVLIGMFGALAAVLMYFQISVPFAPPFYKIDFGDVPGLIGGFAMGPVAGIFITLVKIMIKLLIQGTTTMYVGDLGNFLGSVSFIIPAAMIYQHKKTKKTAWIALGAGAIVMVCWSVIGNCFITLPFYGKVAFDGIENIIAMGTAVNPGITNLFTFVIYAIVPFNLLKGAIVAFVTAALYKKVSVVIRMAQPEKQQKKAAVMKLEAGRKEAEA